MALARGVGKGWGLAALRRRRRDPAIAVPGPVAHLDRPATELIGSFFAGVGWGVMVSRAGSIWTVVLQHWILGIALSYFICFG